MVLSRESRFLLLEDTLGDISRSRLNVADLRNETVELKFANGHKQTFRSVDVVVPDSHIFPVFITPQS